MDIGSKIRNYRKQKNCTLAQISERVGISPSYLSEIEQGKKKASIKAVIRICDALGINPSEILPTENDLQEVPELSLGGKLKAARMRKGWTLHEASKEADISPAYLSQIERSQVNPSLDVLKRLADVLQVALPVIMNRTSPSELGDRLRNTRVSLGLSRKELAGKAGISASLVAQIEQGKSGASLDTIERLAIALGVTPCSLILDNENANADLLSSFKPECQALLSEPRVQSVLRMVCDLSEREFRFILNMIQMFRQVRAADSANYEPLE